MTLYTEDQLHEVTSWLKDEGRSVTVTTVSQSLGLSRSQAQALLEQLLLKEREGTLCFRVTVNESTDNSTAHPIQTTVYKLSQSNSANDRGYLYAVTEKESLATAHERDMVQMREMLKNSNQLDNLTANATDAIAPAEQVIPLMERNLQSSDRPLVSTLDRSKTVAPVKKSTTAESFFQKKKTATKTKETPKAKETTKKESENSKTDNSSKQPKEKATSKDNEKENNGKSSKVGSVDDFVGDDDDSEDDPMEIDAAPTWKIIRGRKQRKEEVEAADVVAVEKKVAVPAWGAMDQFATAEAKRPTEQGRRRRKKLVQTTSMDAEGYLHTETQEMWEDIPSDEEKVEILNSKKPAAQQLPTKKTAMKQGTLKGFFTKK